MTWEKNVIMDIEIPNERNVYTFRRGNPVRNLFTFLIRSSLIEKIFFPWAQVLLDLFADQSSCTGKNTGYHISDLPISDGGKMFVKCIHSLYNMEIKHWF